MSGSFAEEDPAEPSVLSSSALMAVGTAISRFSGYLRAGLLVAALGTGMHADIFNVANTIPNMLYILLAGGVFNAVLVPQLVRAIRNDPDGGEAYTNRVITVAAVFLGAVSVLLVVAAPAVMHVLVAPKYYDPSNAAQLDSLITFARFCLPQVFFYGMFVLVGQVLNARRSFGPMMWAPIANNVISVAVLVLYLITIGSVSTTNKDSAFSGGAEALLGLGSTFGIVVQFLILIPYLRRSGFTFRPRFDLRGTGLGQTFKLGVWTILFVVVNQVAYTVVVRLASDGSASGGTGYTIYSNSFLLVMVPHAIITVSLATAVLPQLTAHAASDRRIGLALSVSQTLRSTYAFVMPVLVVIPLVAKDLASIAFGWGAARNTYADFVPTVSLFALGVFFFTTHYLVLRGFYALEQNRRVFFIQCFISIVNIIAAVALTRGVDPQDTAPRLVIAYAISYALGAAISFRQLSVQTHGLGGAMLVRFVIRLVVVVGLATLVAWGVKELLQDAVDGTGKIVVLFRLAVVGGAEIGSYLVFAKLFRFQEVTEVTEILAARFRRPRKH